MYLMGARRRRPLDRPAFEVVESSALVVSEYRDVLPLLATRRRAIAMDTIGFGDSDRLEGVHSAERFAEVVLEFLDAG